MPLQKHNILYVPDMDFITPTIQHTEDGRIIIELYDKATQTFMGVLYYEKAKNGFSKKPVGLNKMACVDAKIETLFNLHPHLQPKDVLDYCQSLVEGGDKVTKKIGSHNPPL